MPGCLIASAPFTADELHGDQMLEGKQARVDQEFKGGQVCQYELPSVDFRLAHFVGIDKDVDDQTLLADLGRDTRYFPKLI